MAGFFALWYDSDMSLTIQWPSITAIRAEVWAVLHLAGMAKSVRQAKELVKRGFVFLNGNPVSMKTTAAFGVDFELEVRTQYKSRSNTFRLVNREYWEGRNARSVGPRVEHRRG